jgi:flagellar hook-associated protein 2
VISDAIAGSTLTLKTPNSPAEELVLENDVAGTAANLQKLVSAYNDVITLVQKQLAVDQTTDRTNTLAGDSTIRHLQMSLQQMFVSQIGSGPVHSLADVGFETARNGTISLDQSTLASAMSRDPGAVNQLFADASTGLGVTASNLADLFSNSSNGLLTTRQNSLNKSVSQMDTDAANIQIRIDNYRATLVAQFTAMENTISKLKATGEYLTQQASQSEA